MLSPVFLTVHAQTALCCQGGVHAGSGGSPGRAGMCACLDRQSQVLCRQEGGQRMGHDRGHCPNLILALLTLTSSFPSLWNFRLLSQPSQSASDCLWYIGLSLLALFLIGVWESSQTLALLDGAQQALIFFFICCLAFFRTWGCILISPWFELSLIHI